MSSSLRRLSGFVTLLSFGTVSLMGQATAAFAQPPARLAWGDPEPQYHSAVEFAVPQGMPSPPSLALPKPVLFAPPEVVLLADDLPVFRAVQFGQPQGSPLSRDLAPLWRAVCFTPPRTDASTPSLSLMLVSLPSVPALEQPLVPVPALPPVRNASLQFREQFATAAEPVATLRFQEQAPELPIIVPEPSEPQPAVIVTTACRPTGPLRRTIGLLQNFCRTVFLRVRFVLNP